MTHGVVVVIIVKFVKCLFLFLLTDFILVNKGFSVPIKFSSPHISISVSMYVTDPSLHPPVHFTPPIVYPPLLHPVPFLTAVVV